MGFGPVNGPYTSVVSSLSDGGGTETVVLTSSKINTDRIQNTVSISGVVNIATNADTTAVVVNVRKWTTASGTLIEGFTQTVDTGGDTISFPYATKDQPPESHGLQYCVTVTETTAAAAGTVEVGVLTLIVSQA